MDSSRVRTWPQDPAVIGPYRVLGRLGSGAMGHVFLASSPGLHLVAVKTIREGLVAHPGFRARFAQELAAARLVSGAYTAAVIDSDVDARVPWIATAYIPAPSLAEVVDEAGPLTPEAACWLAAGCAEALEAVHGAGLVHRDVKPSNILVGLDGIRVIDFGLARAPGMPRLTSPGLMVGTPMFMAPEQALGAEPVGPAADVFALGAVLAFAASGRVPYADAPDGAAVLAERVGRAPDLGGLPGELGRIVAACLDHDPAARPRPREILERLTALLPDDPRDAPLSPRARDLVAAYAAASTHPSAAEDATRGQRSTDPGASAGSMASAGDGAHGPGRSHGGRRRSRRDSLAAGPALAAAGALLTVGAAAGWLLAGHGGPDGDGDRGPGPRPGPQYAGPGGPGGVGGPGGFGAPATASATGQR